MNFNIGNLHIEFYFEWHHLWIGFHYDQPLKIIYFCPLPCCVISFQKKCDWQYEPMDYAGCEGEFYQGDLDWDEGYEDCETEYFIEDEDEDEYL
jgi:hypothetical protein